MWLRDFPSNLGEFQALQKETQQIDTTFVIEEKFLIMPVEDDGPQFQPDDFQIAKPAEGEEGAEENKEPEDPETKQADRLAIYNALKTLNSQIRKAPVGSKERLNSIIKMPWWPPKIEEDLVTQPSRPASAVEGSQEKVEGEEAPPKPDLELEACAELATEIIQNVNQTAQDL